MISYVVRSSRHALRHRLGELGYQVPDADMGPIYERFLAIADAKKQVFDEDLVAIMEEHDVSSAPGFEIVGFQTIAGTKAIPTATVEVRTPSGEVVRESAAGSGPVEAVYAAIDRATGLPCRLLEYRLRAVRENRDAVGEARVKVEHAGRTAVGLGASTDVVEASARAYMSAVNRIRQVEANGGDRPAAAEAVS